MKLSNIDNKLLIATIVIMSFVMLKQYRTGLKNKRQFTELIGTETEFKKLKDENMLLKNKYVKQEDLRLAAEREFGVAMEVLQNRIKILSNVTATINEKARETGNSDVKYVTKSGQHFLLNEIKFNDGPAVGYVLIFSDGRMVSKMYDHDISVTQVVSRNESNGKYSIVAHADYILKSPSLNKDWYNKPYRLKAKYGEALIDPTEPINQKKSFMWSPRLNMNAIFNLKPQAGLSVSLAGYGYSKNDLQYKFIDLGVVYDHNKEEIKPTLMPILFRPLPNYLPNTYVGPGLMIDNVTEVKYFGGLQVGF